MILAEAPSGRYWVIEATLTSAIEEKEKPSVINAALSAVEMEDFLLIFSSVMVAIFLKTNNNKLRTQLSKSFFYFSLTAARLQDVVVVLFLPNFKEKE